MASKKQKFRSWKPSKVLFIIPISISVVAYEQAVSPTCPCTAIIVGDGFDENKRLLVEGIIDGSHFSPFRPLFIRTDSLPSINRLRNPSFRVPTCTAVVVVVEEKVMMSFILLLIISF